MTTTTKPSTTNEKLGHSEQFMKNLCRNELGALLAEYVNESNHSDWEGFTTSDKRGIGKFLEDIERYWNAMNGGEKLRMIQSNQFTADVD